MRTIDRAWLAMCLLAWHVSGSTQESTALTAPTGPFEDKACIACHADRNPQRVQDHLDGPHRAIGCTACHGERHGRLPAARADTSCITCHEGAEADSHAHSKHGVLLRIDPPDWTAPLQRGRYRAPGCAYCHLHDGDHGDRMAPARGRDQLAWVCGGCHSPRFADTQLEAGERLVAIAKLKQREAQALALCLPADGMLRTNLLARVGEHLRNVRLGAGHLSPDYQWWYGQPALDGDLIRLRDRVESLRRTAGVNPANTQACRWPDRK